MKKHIRKAALTLLFALLSLNSNTLQAAESAKSNLASSAALFTLYLTPQHPNTTYPAITNR